MYNSDWGFTKYEPVCLKGSREKDKKVRLLYPGETKRIPLFLNSWHDWGTVFPMCEQGRRGQNFLTLTFFLDFYMLFLKLLIVSLRVQGSAYLPVFTKSLHSLVVSLVTGRLTTSTLHLYASPFYRVIWPVRKENDLQSCWSGNRTRATQPELTLFRAPYPLDHHSLSLKCLL